MENWSFEYRVLIGRSVSRGMNTTNWMVVKTKNILSLVSRLGSHQNNFDDISRSNILTTSFCSFLGVHCVLIGWFVSYEMNAVLWLVTRRSETLSTLCSAIKMSTEPPFTVPLFLLGLIFSSNVHQIFIYRGPLFTMRIFPLLTRTVNRGLTALQSRETVPYLFLHSCKS